ncbi:hypothetical protein ABPG72_004913 [Tetrahymena utriculariae]
MVKETQSKQELLRERVYNFYMDNKNRGKSYTYKHFQEENIAKSTICRIIKLADEGLSPKRKQGSGRITKIFPKKQLSSLKKAFDHNDGISQRQAAQRYRCSQSYICKVLKKHTDIRCLKKKVIPARTDKQRGKIRGLCGKLYLKFKNYFWIMDDESNFTLKNSHINGNPYYYSSNKSKTPAKVKFNPKKNSKRNCQSGQLSQKKKLLPFIRENHINDNFIFWPDLSTSHYAKSVQQFMTNNNINFVPKEQNPPNTPEVRPIEDFWLYLKGQVYNNNWEAKNISQLKRKINICIKKIDQNYIKNLMSSIPKRLNLIRRKGLIEQR